MGAKKVLFVCVENSCRSQMAEGFARKLGKGIVEAYSAGSKPSGQINPLAVEVMKEAGIDISCHTSKGFDNLAIRGFDYVISMGCADVCPFVPAKKHIEWKIDDPKGKAISRFRQSRDEIRNKVTELIRNLSADDTREVG